MRKLFLLVILLLGLISSIVLLRNRQDIRNQATSTSATISLNPRTTTLDPNQTIVVNVITAFTNGSQTENLDYYKTVINFPKDKFNLTGVIDTSTSGFDSELRVDTPTIANGSGKIIIELLSTSANSGPKTSSPITIAKVTFKAIAPTAPTADNITIEQAQTEIVNNLSEDLVLNPSQNAKYTVRGQASDPTSTPTTNPNLVKVGTIRFKALPDIGGTAEIKFSNILQSMVVERGASDILGQVSGLNLNIGAGGTPPVDGDIKLAFKTKIRDLNHDAGMLKYKLKVKKAAFSKEFSDLNANWTGEFYAVENVSLAGVIPGDGYQFFVKGPKHLARGFENITLVSGNNTLLLTDKNLEPGDLPPQDGVINSSDISRLIDLLEVANPSVEQLATGDLNFDGAINGADVNEIILTLSTKYDDDRF